MAKRNNDNISLNDALKGFIKANKLQKGIDKVNASEAWAKLMGNGGKQLYHCSGVKKRYPLCFIILFGSSGRIKSW